MGAFQVGSHVLDRVAESRCGRLKGGNWRVTGGEDCQEWLSRVIAGIGGRELTVESSNFLPKPQKEWATRRYLRGSGGGRRPSPKCVWQARQVPIVRIPFRMEQFCGWFLPYYIKMRKSDLTAKEWSSVPCPTCGVAPGEPCLLHSGALRTEPHVDRKLSAVEAIEANRISRGPRRP